MCHPSSKLPCPLLEYAQNTRKQQKAQTNESDSRLLLLLLSSRRITFRLCLAFTDALALSCAGCGLFLLLCTTTASRLGRSTPSARFFLFGLLSSSTFLACFLGFFSRRFGSSSIAVLFRLLHFLLFLRVALWFRCALLGLVFGSGGVLVFASLGFVFFGLFGPLYACQSARSRSIARR